MILSVKEIRESEQYTMQIQSISSIELMEEAGTTIASHILEDFAPSTHHPIAIYCGPGNNGGDGLVIARYFLEHGYPVTVVLCTFDHRCSDEMQTNLLRLQTMSKSLKDINILSFHDISSCSNIQPQCIVDALFGIGLNRSLTEEYASVIHHINTQNVPIFSVDIPSGLFADTHTPQTAPRIHATTTYTCQWLKWAFILPENEHCVGNICLTNIGLQLPTTDKFEELMAYPKQSSTHNYLITKDLVNKILPPPHTFAHKGSNGHGVLLAGSTQMPGAALLSAKAAIRSGLGKLTVHTTAAVAKLLPITTPEVLLDTDDHDLWISKCTWQKFSTCQAIAIGPGIGQAQPTRALLKDLLSEVHSPIIIDADALNILSTNKTWLSSIPPYSIITPHFKEFERLAGPFDNDFDRLTQLQLFANKYQIIIILKGAYSIVAMPHNHFFINTTGNPGMATAGSGDVLTGILLGLLSRGLPPTLTAIAGVYIHGLAGDCALKHHSFDSIIASDIIDNIGYAFREIRTPNPNQN